MLQARSDILASTEAATAVALSVLLGNLRLLELPNGGSITLACVPLLALACVRGLRAGLLAGGCAGAAHALAGGTIVHPVQLLLDYGVAYAALGLVALAGTVRGPRLLAAIVAVAAVQLAATTTSGVVFFAAATGSTSAALTYSLLYNAATIVPECLLACLLVPVACRAVCRADPARAWRRGLATPPRAVPRAPRYVQAPAAPMAQVPIPARAAQPPSMRTAQPGAAPFVRVAPFSPRRPVAPRAPAPS